MVESRGYAAQSKESPLAPYSFTRREPDATDVQIEILYCGVCHSDLHQVRSDWGDSFYPIVPGHEIVGKVTRVGENVAKFKVDDVVAVGCMVYSCRDCCHCKDGLEQYCLEGATWTYNSPDRKGDGVTYGGYANNIVVDEAFVLKMPDNLDLAAAAPLLCAGITSYSPLRNWKVGPGTKMGVVGLGGLGHMAIKFGKAFGAEVTLFTTSPDKAEDAKRLGASTIINSKDADAMAAYGNKLDFILNTVAVKHDLAPYLATLRLDGTMCMVGIPDEPFAVGTFNLVRARNSLAGSGIGGIKETQEMLDYCGENNITSDVEVIPISKINEAYDRMVKSDVKYRFVIDMSTLD